MRGNSLLNNYEAFKKEIYQLTHIDLNAYKERQMKRRIDSLIRKNGFETYEDYVKAIKKEHQLFQEFVNYLTINVSEFYRNPEQWNILEKEIFPYLFQTFGKKIKIWSAACSTGDEPYSLAMLLSNFLPLSQIQILATDIDKQILEKASMGLYSEKSLAALPQIFKNKYLNQVGDRAYQISDEIKKCITFKQHNLLKDDYPTQCDLIVCRNVLIYFTEEAKTEIYKKFNASLKNNGILFVGSTEQIIQPQVFAFSAFRSFYYKKEKDLRS